jgi:hypothetical protein
MVKQQSLVAMEVHPPSGDEEISPRYPKQTRTRQKYGRQSPDRMSSMDEDDVTSFVHCLKPLRESQDELKEQIRSVRSDMRRYQAANREQLNRFHTKDWVLFCFLTIVLLWQWYAQSSQTSTTVPHS